MANTSLLKPTSVEVALSENNPNRAVITLEPFERGYGHTLGNALRRILLSSMIGFAPTEVQITGIVHEYSQIDGVLEDVVDILLNLKGVVFKLDGRDEVTVMLRKDGEGVVTAADFDLPHDVSVVNPDHVIAHLSGGRLEMQVKIEKGRGYQPGDVRAFRDDYSKAAIGRIIMDASFSPILRVAYQVQAARVAQRTDLDKLEMTIETNGAIGPEDALREAVRILQDQLAVFGTIHQDTGADAAPAEEDEDVPPPLDPAPSGRRSRAHGSFRQLPQGREHLLHRRSDPAHGKRASQDAEPRPQVPERNQGSARRPRPHARLPSRKLAARPGTLMDRKGVVAVR